LTKNRGNVELPLGGEYVREKRELKARTDLDHRDCLGCRPAGFHDEYRFEDLFKGRKYSGKKDPPNRRRKGERGKQAHLYVGWALKAVFRDPSNSSVMGKR